MAVPSYTEDLTDLTLAENNADWLELTGTIGGEAYNANGAPVGADPDYPFIQGSYSVTQDCTKDTSVGSLSYNPGSGTGGHGTDGAYFVWQNYMVASNIGTYAQGGFQICVGSALGDFDTWYVGGVDKSPYPYGGWNCNVVNTTVTPDGTAGTPGTEQIVASAVYIVQGSSKGEVHNCDVIRYGRGSAIFESGETSDYCTIAGFAIQNDNNSNRWGLISATSGGYLWQGRMSLGSSGTACDFRDSNVTIFIKWTPKVTANFNTIEVVNTGSNVEMIGFQFICLDPANTASLGRWITTDVTATVVLDTCFFIDMSTFIFGSGTTATDCSWTRCAQIDPGGGDISRANITESTAAVDTGAVLWNDPGDPNTKMGGSTFTKGINAHHAIEFGTSAPTTINLTDMTFSDFNAADANNDSVLLFPDTGGDVTWTVQHTGTTGILSYKQVRVGDTVNISSSVPVTVTVKDIGGTLLDNIQTAVFKTSDRTQIMNEDTVSGVATENYTGATPVEVEVRCRKASTGSTKYKSFSSIQTVSTTGLSFAVTLIEDNIASA